MSLDISFNLGNPGLGGCQPAKGSGNGVSALSNLNVERFPRFTEEGEGCLMRGDMLELQK